MRKILAIITFLMFLLLLWYSYSSYKECCSSSNSNNEIENTNTTVLKKVVTIKKIPAVKKDGSLFFNWNSDLAIENEFWNVKKARILSGLSDEKILRILGPYFKEEGELMGIARAKVVYNKFSDEINTEKVEFGSKLVEYYEGAKTNPFSGTSYTWQVRNKNITEIDNKTLIYFPTNSTKKINNKNISTYLKDVARSLKNNNKKISLSGHTDNVGNPSKNKQLALNRAQSLKNELVNLGISADRIYVASFGEEKPIATNDSNEGRQKNRRVELEIK